MSEAPGPFAQPWHAQVFALVVALRDRGVFSATQWSQVLGEVKAAALADPVPGACDGDDWPHWVAALERLVVERGLAAPLALTALRQAWRVAAEVTPHGQPIVLGAAARARASGFRSTPQADRDTTA